MRSGGVSEPPHDPLMPPLSLFTGAKEPGEAIIIRLTIFMARLGLAVHTPPGQRSPGWCEAMVDEEGGGHTRGAPPAGKSCFSEECVDYR